MRNTLFAALSIVILSFVLAPTSVLAQESGAIVEVAGDTHHGTIPRGTGEKVDPAKMGLETEEAKACIERRKKKHQVDGPHPWIPPLAMSVPAPDVMPGPHGPATPPMSLEKGGSNPLLLYKNTDILTNSNVSTSSLEFVLEPTAIMMRDEVLYTANWFAARSTDGGDTFTYLSPYSGPFTSPVGQSFCCDQTSAYDPGTNTAFWLQLYTNTIPSAATQRINVDQNADGTWDCYYDITAQMMGWGANRWTDFPDLAVSSNYLWHTSNVFTSASVFDNSFAARYPLSELSTCAATLSFDTQVAGFFSLRLARGMTDTGYWATHYSQTQIRVGKWPDADPSPSWKAGLTDYWSDDLTRACPGWDGRDWCGRHDRRIQGVWVADGVIGVMWVPSQDPANGFPFPYTRVARYDEASMSHIDDVDIWSPEVAYAYPAVAVNSEGALGGTIMWGGGDTYANNCSVWIADDENGGVLAPLEHEVSIQGSFGPLRNEGGDYTMARMAYPDTTHFVGACFANKIVLWGNPMFVHFGRDVVVEPYVFSDGFESGNTTAWSVTTQ